jgi:hypothetical protein
MIFKLVEENALDSEIFLVFKRVNSMVQVIPPGNVAGFDIEVLSELSFDAANPIH